MVPLVLGGGGGGWPSSCGVRPSGSFPGEDHVDATGGGRPPARTGLTFRFQTVKGWRVLCITSHAGGGPQGGRGFRIAERRTVVVLGTLTPA